MATVFEEAVKYTTQEGFTRVVYSRYMKGMYYREPCFETGDKRREMDLFEPISIDNKVVPESARVDLEMQRFRQLSGPLNFGGTSSGFTITLTGPSYIVERL